MSTQSWDKVKAHIKEQRMDKLTKHLIEKSMSEKKREEFITKEALLWGGVTVLSLGTTVVTTERWYVGLILVVLGLGSLMYRSYLKKQ